VKKYKRLSEIIFIPVDNEKYFEIFREMHENNPLSTLSDNRVVDRNLILYRLENRNKLIVIQCKDKIQTEELKTYPGLLKIRSKNRKKKKEKQ